jgi:ankyrin repeat protein
MMTRTNTGQPNKTRRLVITLALALSGLQMAAAQAAPAAPITPSPAVAAIARQDAANLFDAVRGGDIEAIKAALNAGAEVNIRDAQGRTPLLFAAAAGRQDIVNLLLEKGADPNIADNAGRTALHLVLAGEAVEKLPEAPKKKRGLFGKLESGAKGIVKTVERTATGALNMVGAGGLLKNGMAKTFGRSLLMNALPFMSVAGAFGQGGQGWSALLGASLSGGANPTTLAGLIPGASGANAGAGMLNASGWTSLISSAKQGKADVVNALRNAPGIGEADRAVWSQFVDAAEKGDTETVQRLMADPRVAGIVAQAQSGLANAAKNLPGADGGAAIARALIEKGADVNKKDQNGRTPLDRAKADGLKELVGALGG